MAIQNIYLRIETIADYSPVEPQIPPPPNVQYKRDGMRFMGHPDGTIPDAEVQARSLTALIYREYMDANYLIPKTSKLVEADINEPSYARRVPGTVIYTWPGNTLKIHVHNADNKPHSFHTHGLRYGIDSDGAWPMGTQSSDGRRSDEICPGQSWTYTFEVTSDMLGAWPFHDHSRHTDPSVLRGLFGGIVVRPKKPGYDFPVPFPGDFRVFEKEILKLAGGRLQPREALPPIARAYVAERHDYLKDWVTKIIGVPRHPPFVKGTLKVPVFFHRMATEESTPLFDSGDLEENGVGTFSHTFDEAGDFGYFCQFHPIMQGTVTVIGGAPATATVNIVDGPPMGFAPATIQIAPGGTVTWVNQSQQHHTATSDEGASIPTHCINGRGFIGNSPTVLAKPGQKIRWYVFNLDFGREWHNFHTHAMRWEFAGDEVDVRSIGPAESFVAETRAPPVAILPPAIDAIQDRDDRPDDARRYWIMGDFVFHCHVHHHMMNGMIGTVRSVEEVWLTDAMKTELEDEHGIHIWSPSNGFPAVDPDRCGEGYWEELAVDPEVTFMHSCLLPNTSKVLYWGYTRDDQSRLFDPATGTVTQPTNQPASLPGETAGDSDLWSGCHTFFDDAVGTLLAHGGLTNGAGGGPTKSYLFDPATETWSATAETVENRFYATTITVSDGTAPTICGSSSKSIEVYDPGSGTWGTPIALPLPQMAHHVYYPWTYLLPSGKLFIAGPHDPTHRFDWNPVANVETLATIAGNRSTVAEKGTSVLLMLRPPNYEPQVVIMGGNLPAAEKTSEIINLSAASPAWASLPDLNFARPQQVNSVLLPDGRIFLAGGITSGADGGACEIYDPANVGPGWQVGPTMQHKRGYHSSMILLADGSILFGGDPTSTAHERFYPGYYHQPRPDIANAPASVAYGASFQVDTPQASDIAEVVLLRPGAVTHGFNMSQRGVECAITGGGAGFLTVTSPPDAYVAPPGWYLLFLLASNRTPSVGSWIRLTP